MVRKPSQPFAGAPVPPPPAPPPNSPRPSGRLGTGSGAERTWSCRGVWAPLTPSLLRAARRPSSPPGTPLAAPLTLLTRSFPPGRSASFPESGGEAGGSGRHQLSPHHAPCFRPTEEFTLRRRSVENSKTPNPLLPGQIAGPRTCAHTPAGATPPKGAVRPRSGPRGPCGSSSLGRSVPICNAGDGRGCLQSPQQLPPDSSPDTPGSGLGDLPLVLLREAPFLGGGGWGWGGVGGAAPPLSLPAPPRPKLQRSPGTPLGQLLGMKLHSFIHSRRASFLTPPLSSSDCTALPGAPGPQLPSPPPSPPPEFRQNEAIPPRPA